MKSRSRLRMPVLLALALLVPASGAVMADEAAEPAAVAVPATTEPAPEASSSDPDCGCEARSPAQLLETQRELNEAVAEPGS